MCDLEDLVQQYARCPKGKWIAPRTLARRMLTEDVGMDFGHMHDAHEFMALLLDRMLVSNLKGAPEHDSHDLQDAQECMTLQHHLFGSLLVNVVECEGCGYKTPGRAERSVAFMLPMHAPNGMNDDSSSGIRAWVRGAAQRVGEKVGVVEGASETIEDLLRYFISPVEIQDYRCDRCHRKAADMGGKRICMREALADAPRVLALAIKRFCGGHFGKLSKPVTFEETLDLAPFIEPNSMNSVGRGDGEEDSRQIWSAQQRPLADGPCMYGLTGVVVHRGLMNSVNAGHYIAYVRCGDDWFLIDDEEVTRTTWETVSRVNAYMLFYMKLAREEDSFADQKSSSPQRASTPSASTSSDSGSTCAVVETSPAIDATCPPYDAETSTDGKVMVTRGMNNLKMAESQHDVSEMGTAETDGACDAPAVGVQACGGSIQGKLPTARSPPPAPGSGIPASPSSVVCPKYECVEDSGIAKVFDGAAHYKLTIWLPTEESLVSKASDEVKSFVSSDSYVFESPGYRLHVDWPRKTDESRQRARFIRNSRTLVVHAAILA